MLDQEISREKPKKQQRKKRTHSRVSNAGLAICIVTVVLGILTAVGWPSFLATGMYGIFGVYVYAVFFLVLALGLSMRFSRKYSVNVKYVVCASVMLFALFTALHLGVTNQQLGAMSFGKYLEYGFNNITPGGVFFAIPAFVIWNVFDGVVGSSIVLGGTFILATAFLATFIVTKHGVNKVIKKKPVTQEPEFNNVPYSTVQKELNEQVEQRYQELLQKQSRTKINKQKSELGLTAPPTKADLPPIYDDAVPLNQLAPQGVGGAMASAAPANFVADEITHMSTEAANKLMQGIQQPLYSAPPSGYAPQGYSPAPMQQGGYNYSPYGASYGAQPMPYTPQVTPVPSWTPPTSSPVFNEPPPQSTATAPVLNNYSQEESEEVYTPTARARNKVPAVAPGQTQLDGVMDAAKPMKAFKSRRYNRPGIELIRTESTDLTDFHNDAAIKQKMLDAKFKEFNIGAKVTNFTVAPAITRFEVELGLGTRANDVYRLENDFQIILGTTSIRMENVAGKNAIGIEVPNKQIGCVSIKDILLSKEWAALKSPLGFAIGKNISDEVVIGDIGTLPHLLIAGSTGSGKSVCINTILTSLIYRAHPDDVKLLLVDMKLVELGMYNDIPHMLIPRSIGEVQQAIHALKWMQDEMRRRYKILQANGLKHISQYQAMPGYQNGQIERMPYIVMVIDEAADLIYSGKREVEDAVKQLAALGRASGIHLILATQRPSVDVITAVIKANLPVRIGFKVVSRGDSTTIINEVGCEKLVGRGDMLFSKEGKIQRVQGAYIDDEEARRVINYIRENNTCDFDSELEDIILNGPPPENAAVGFGDGPSAARNQDPLYVPVLRWLVRDENTNRTASISGIQRQFGLGFGRAGKIIDQLAGAGYVSAGNGVKVREVLISRDEVDNIYGNE